MYSLRLLGTFLVQCIAVAGVPQFAVNLDLPAEIRWREVATFYRKELKAMSTVIEASVKDAVGESFDVWANGVAWSDEMLAEMQGFVTEVNDPAVTLKSMKVSNLLYEMASPTMCSAVLQAYPNGTVMHGRNMDYSLSFTMPDGTKLGWPDVTYEVTMYKLGKKLLKTVMWPGSVGFHTAMRYDGWTIDQQTRHNNEWHLNLAAALQGGQPFGTVIRDIMLSTKDFGEAVQKVYAAKYMAPQYFIMSGAKPYEGAVLTIDRMGNHEADSPPIQYLMQQTPDSWYLVQTNDDLMGTSTDPRAAIANIQLKTKDRTAITETSLMSFMHTPLLFNPSTAFSSVMVPATGYFETILPRESASLLQKTKKRQETLLQKQKKHNGNSPASKETHLHQKKPKLRLQAHSDQNDEESAFMQTAFELREAEGYEKQEL